MNSETPQPFRDKTDEIDLWQALGAIWRGKFLVALFALITTFIGAYFAFQIAQAQFSSTATLVLQVRNQQVVDIESVVSGVSTEEEAINTELEVIKSRELLEQLVTDLKLTEDPEFNLDLRVVSPFSLRGAKDAIINLFGGDDDTGPRSPQEIVRNTADQVRKSIVVSAHNDTYIFSIRALTSDADKSALIANRLSEIYIANQVDIKFSMTEAAVDWLSERVEQLQLELKAREDAVKAMQAETNLISEEALEALRLRAKGLRERVADARGKAIDATTQLSNIVALSSGENYQDIAIALDDPILLRIAPRIATSGNASARDTAIGQFEARVTALIDNAEQIANRAVVQRDLLQNTTDELQLEINAQNADLVRLNQLTQEAEATQILYSTFLTRLEETSVQIGLQQPDSRILSSAVSGEQIAPRRSRIFVLSFILGTMLGIGFVVTRQFFYQGVRSIEELESLSGLPVLGAVPKMPIRRRRALISYLNDNPTSAAVEAVRNLRTSILMSNIAGPPKVIVITSTVPGEGKTTVAISLAHNLAGLEKKVLLINGDIRRRTMDQYIQYRAISGLVSVVNGEMTLDDIIVQDDSFGFDMVLGEKTRKNAADIFSSPEFANLVEAAREKYDYIIIDTPPVLVVPDARIISRSADFILYAALWNQTPQASIRAGLKQLSSLGLKIGGMALSKVDPRGVQRYGYGSNYGGYGGYGRYKGYYDN